MQFVFVFHTTSTVSCSGALDTAYFQQQTGVQLDFSISIVQAELESTWAMGMSS